MERPDKLLERLGPEAAAAYDEGGGVKLFRMEGGPSYPVLDENDKWALVLYITEYGISKGRIIRKVFEVQPDLSETEVANGPVSTSKKAQEVLAMINEKYSSKALRPKWDDYLKWVQRIGEDPLDALQVPVEVEMAIKVSYVVTETKTGKLKLVRLKAGDGEWRNEFSMLTPQIRQVMGLAFTEHEGVLLERGERMSIKAYAKLEAEKEGVERTLWSNENLVIDREYPAVVVPLKPKARREIAVKRATAALAPVH